MTRRILFLVCLAAAAAAPAGAQRREFLTDGEIAEIREAQEPDKRLKLYVKYAEQRVAAIEKMLAADETNRASAIHDHLSEYDSIIEAVDHNVEQLVKRRELARKGLEAALDAEPQFLKQLQALRARNPKDLAEYRFILDQAIETTESSIAVLREALAKQPKDRKQERDEKKKREKDEGEREKRRGERGA